MSKEQIAREKSVHDLVDDVGMKTVLEGLLSFVQERRQDARDEPYLEELEGNIEQTLEDYEARYEEEE
jgi:hypothetical protein